MKTKWKGCKPCGATTRHDDGKCIRHPEHVAQRRWPGAFGASAAVIARHRTGEPFRGTR